MDYISKGKEHGKVKSKGNNSQGKNSGKKLTITKSVTCAETRVTSHETVGHEPTTTRW